MLDGQTPAIEVPEYFYPPDPIAYDHQEAARIQRQSLSGPLGQGPYALEYGALDAQSSEAKERDLERQAKARAVNGGLPDSW